MASRHTAASKVMETALSNRARRILEGRNIPGLADLFKRD
jgi:hypothetical protein